MKNSNFFKIITVSSCLISSSALAQNSNIIRPDSHAPIGVMRDHIHDQGQYMLSYRYELMKMRGMQNGSDSLSDAEVLNDYMMTPKKMNMKMHMAGAMYGVTDNLTLAVMGTAIEKEMTMVNRNNRESQREISGFGDLKLNSMYGFFKNENSHAQFNLGVSLPTGSIKEQEGGSRVAYPMQLGSGSYEILPGISFTSLQENYSYGAQLNSTLRLNENNAGYKLGNIYNTTAWVAKSLNESISISSRLNYTMKEKTTGYDKTIHTMMNLNMSPANNSANSGMKRLDFLLGANFIMPNGALKGHRLAVEGGVPLYQKFNGIQMKNDYSVTLGWQKSF